MRKALQKSLFAILIILSLSTITQSDGILLSKSGFVEEPSQEAFIKKEGNKETIVLRVQAQGNVKDLGWVIPLPSYPDVSEGEEELFQDLELLTKTDWRGLGKFVKSPSQSVDGVQVETDYVGIYEVNKIRADDKNALFDWLNEHNFKQEPGVKEILGEYIERNFSFIAVKINLEKWDTSKSKKYMDIPYNAGSPDSEWISPENLTTDEPYISYSQWLDPLRIKFDSDNLFYPMKISSLNNGHTDLIIWVIDDTMMTFPQAEIMWCEKIHSSDKALKSISREFTGSRILTRLEYSVVNVDITDDIILEPQHFQFVSRQIAGLVTDVKDSIYYYYSDIWFVLFCIFVLTAVGTWIALFVQWRKSRKTGTSKNDSSS